MGQNGVPVQAVQDVPHHLLGAALAPGLALGQVVLGRLTDDVGAVIGDRPLGAAGNQPALQDTDTVRITVAFLCRPRR